MSCWKLSHWLSNQYTISSFTLFALLIQNQAQIIKTRNLSSSNAITLNAIINSIAGNSIKAVCFLPSEWKAVPGRCL